MNNEELFEALSELDDKLIANAKHIDTYGEQTIVLRRTPVWKIVTGFVAAAACVAVLAVGGVLGMKYINGKNAVSPPSDPLNDVSHGIGISIAYAPAEYPKEAKYVYTGDYSELTMIETMCIDYVEYYDSIIRLEEKSDLIVIGEFTDDPHQTNDPKVDGTQIVYGGDSFNMFRVDRVIKGNCVEGQTILICQYGVVTNGYFHCNDNFTPMLKGDKWIYFLNKSSDREMYFPLHDTGRFPVPGSEHEFVLNDNVYGVFGGSETVAEIYGDIKERFNDWTYEEYFESEYPDDAEPYNGDYSGLNAEVTDNEYRKEVLPYEEIFNERNGCDFIVSGEFIDDPRQYFWSVDDGYVGKSYNKFRVDKVFKGDIKEGQIIIIKQDGFVVDDTYYADDNLTPMINGDKWLYCLSKTNGICSAYDFGNGRYPIPGSGNKSLDFTDGYYGVCDTEYANKEVYERLLNELDIAVTKDFDGVVLSVMMDGKNFDVNYDIRIKATVRNTTDKPIGLLMPCQGENSHTEISTRISRGRTMLVDKDTYEKDFDEALDSHIVQPGEEYVQEMNFVIPLMDSIPYPGYEVGEYKGTATIWLLSDPNDVTSEVTERVVEFSLNIVDKNSDTENIPDGADVTKAYEYGKSGEEYWTMPEFPGVSFLCDGNNVSVLTEGNAGVLEHPLYGSYSLYMGMPLEDVYLVDLNGDGNREIVSVAEYGSGIIDSRVYAFDYANGVRYTLCDRGNFDYTLDTDNGGLIVKKFRYNESEILSEQPLTLDMMTTDGSVYVFNGSEPAEWTMDEFPEITFRANKYGVFARRRDGSESNIAIDHGYDIINCVYLLDNDGDGKREIIFEFMDKNGMHVMTSLSANGSLLEYSGATVDAEDNSTVSDIVISEE